MPIVGTCCLTTVESKKPRQSLAVVGTESVTALSSGGHLLGAQNRQHTLELVLSKADAAPSQPVSFGHG